MSDAKHPGGRPPMTKEERLAQARVISAKLEPYLKSGLSIKNALGEAKIGKDLFYDMMDRDESFADTINGYRHFVPILLNNVLVKELMAISEKQNGNPAKNIKPQKLTKEDKDFLWRFALTSNLTKGEFGERRNIDLFDPEAEIQKVKGLIDESTTEEILHDE